MHTIQAFHEVRETAEQIRNADTAAVGTVSAGDVIRQGDLYLVCLGETRIGKLKRLQGRQLAPGTTQGSRHVALGDCLLQDPDTGAKTAIIKAINSLAPSTRGKLIPGRDEPLIGPIVKTRGEVEIDHPEHGNRILPAGETFAVVYQRALADEVRRQLD